MKCAICGMIVDSIDEAVDQGWTPHFYDGDEEHETACPSCTEALLRNGDDGEMEVMEESRRKIRFMEEAQPDPFGEHLLLGVVVSEEDAKIY